MIKLNNGYYPKFKIFNILIASLMVIYTNIIDIFEKNDLDPKYLKVKKFEDSNTKSFLDVFFLESDFSNENISGD